MRRTLFATVTALLLYGGLAMDRAGAEELSAQQVLQAVNGGPQQKLAALALFYELHANEIYKRAVNEDHASAYVRWNRAGRQVVAGRASPVDVAQQLAGVESTRLVLRMAQRRNVELRLKLGHAIGQDIDEEYVNTPPPPTTRPPNIDPGTLAALVTKPAATDGLLGPQARVILVLGDIGVAWQAVISGRAELDYRQRTLTLTQQRYDQERQASMGAAMTGVTHAEAGLARATGDYFMATARLAVLLGRAPATALEPGFMDALGAGGLKSYEPKSGSGFGEQNAKDHKDK